MTEIQLGSLAAQETFPGDPGAFYLVILIGGAHTDPFSMRSLWTLASNDKPEPTRLSCGSAEKITSLFEPSPNDPYLLPWMGTVITLNPFLTVRTHFLFPDRDNLFQPIDSITGGLKDTGVAVSGSAGD